MQFSVLSKPTGIGWIVQHAETLKDARAAARRAKAAGAELFWITDHATGERYGLRGRIAE